MTIPRPGSFSKTRRVALLALTALLPSCSGSEVKSAAPASVPVTVATAKQTDFPIELRAIGSVESLWTVSVRPQVEGALAAIHFREGQNVTAGELLFTIDPRPYQAALAVAEANLAKSRVEAQNAESEQKRAAGLFAQGVISTDASERVAANARALDAGLRADEAAVQTAKLRLDYCSIRSPLAGRTGSILVKVGNLVRALDDATLVVIHQQDPIGVRFTVPEARLAEIQKAGTLAVEARRRGEEADPAKGSLAFVDHEIDRTTGNVKLKARFENAEHRLWPGQFVDVQMTLSVRRGAVTIPAPAVQDGQKGPFVFVVKADKTADIRAVEIGPSRNGETLIEKGLKPGETVVVDGQVRLTVGATVDAKPRGTGVVNLAEVFIRRPVATTLVMAAILFAGIAGYRLLPTSDLPNVDFPTIQVVAVLPGANPDTMAASVATPLEKQFSTIAGLDSMTSVNALGLTQITLQFALDRSIDAAGQDVQAAIGKASSQLPPTMPTAPSYQKVNPADQPVIFMSLHSATRPLAEVDNYAQTLIAQRLSMISGVAQVGVVGSQKYAVRVQLDPSALASRGLGIDEVTSAIQRGNVNLPTGTLSGADQALTVEANGQLTNAAAYRPLVVTYRNGSPVRLEELGRVLDGVENDKVASWFMTDHGLERAITLMILRQPGANTVAVVEAIRQLLPTFREHLPASVELDVLFDRSLSIKESVGDVKKTLLLTVGLVIMVIFLFLRNLPATLIPSLALPMSIVGTFFVMYLLGYSLDNLSLMALTLSVGFVVDDAIVMLENIVRHIERGEAPMEAALRGSKEVSFTILSMTISLVAVFLPVLFMGGLLGRLLHEFAVTISAAILVSGFVSLTLTPMLCSRFLKAQAPSGPRSDHHGGRLFEAVRRGYERSLRVVLGQTTLVMAVAAVILVATAWLFVRMPKGFLPTEDIGQLLIYAEAAQGVSFDAMAAHQEKLSDILVKEPGIESFNSSIGASGSTNTMNSGRLFARLSPRHGRPSAQQIVENLRPKFAAVTGIRVFPQILPPIRIGGVATKSLYQLTLQSSNTSELYRLAPLLEQKMRTLPGLDDVTSDLQIKSPQIHVEIDRDRAVSLGVTAQQVEEALYTAFGTRQVSTIYAPDNQYRVITELLPQFQRDPSTMGLLHVRSSSGVLVPLEAVARLSRTVSPLLVNHLGQLPAVTLSFNLKPGTSLGEGVDRVSAAAREILPPSVTTGFQGAAQAFESSMRGLGWLLLLAIVVIYIVLGVLYESFIHPLTILSGLPAAGFGALVTLSLFGEDLNVYSFVGVIMLVGIVKKNAIMMIDFAIEAQREGKSPKDAIFEGCLVRFRPIMMTTMCALAGTLPIALGIGAGAESRRPLGLAVVGGLLFSQFLTLYMTPVFYLAMERLRSGARRAEERTLAAA